PNFPYQLRAIRDIGGPGEGIRCDHEECHEDARDDGFQADWRSDSNHGRLLSELTPPPAA
ncbi:MAG TPA: hypothetical protein VK137_20775, partial [Planctomycetaceae bacterium]|nr:hypothetical protein [Planctomycetaceae bacterium]